MNKHMSDTLPLEIRIESALFFKGGAMRIKELAEATKESEEKIREALAHVQVSLEGRGVRLVLEKDEAALATAPETHEMIEAMRREELESPLGKAGLETLSVIIFRGPLSRSDIEYVRGVNCSSILRSLMIRGLIERIDNPSDKRSFLYRPTTELPAYLGVTSLTAIPQYAELREGIEKVFAERETVTAKLVTSEIEATGEDNYHD